MILTHRELGRAVLDRATCPRCRWLSRFAVVASLGTLVREGRSLRAPVVRCGRWRWEGPAAFVITAAHVLSVWAAVGLVLAGVVAWAG